MGLLEQLLLARFGPKGLAALLQRNMLQNEDPRRAVNSVIPNVYRGPLQPDFESGNALPQNYEPNQKRRI